MNKQTLLAVSAFDTLPDAALLCVDSLTLICGRGRSTIWREAKLGTFPAPVRCGRSTRWKAGDVRQWLATRSA